MAFSGFDYEWTPWYDRDSPSSNDGSDVESLEDLRDERPGEICYNPLYMQARTREGVSKISKFSYLLNNAG